MNADNVSGLYGNLSTLFPLHFAHFFLLTVVSFQNKANYLNEMGVTLCDMAGGL